MVQKAFRTSSRLDQKRIPPHHIIVKVPSPENKKTTLKTARGNIYKCKKKIRRTSETLKVREAWSVIVQALRIDNCQPRIVHPVKINEEIKTF
jgi:hypothetical protein